MPTARRPYFWENIGLLSWTLVTVTSHYKGFMFQVLVCTLSRCECGFSSWFLPHFKDISFISSPSGGDMIMIGGFCSERWNSWTGASWTMTKAIDKNVFINQLVFIKGHFSRHYSSDVQQGPWLVRHYSFQSDYKMCKKKKTNANLSTI